MADVENIHEYLDINVPPPKGWKFVLRPNMVERTGWIPRVSKGAEPFTELPIKNVILTYDIGTPFCTNHRECIDVVKSTQVMHMEQLNLPDIAYNFLVGSDGKIYEGRGFNALPEKNPKFPELHGNSIEIAFIENDAQNVRHEDFLNVVTFLNHAIYVSHDIAKQHGIFESEPRFFLNTAYDKRPPPGQL